MKGLSVKAFFSDDPLVVEERMRNLVETAESLGLPFVPPQTIYNSRSAQELGLWAESMGKGDAFLQALYAAYFVDSKNIAEVSVLREIAGSVGLSADQVAHVLEAGTYKAQVDRDWSRAKALNILVLPTFLMDQERLVGAQPYAKLEKLMGKADVPKRTG